LLLLYISVFVIFNIYKQEPNNQRYVQSLLNYAGLMKSMNDIEEAKKYYTIARDILQAQVGPNHKLVQQINNLDIMQQ